MAELGDAPPKLSTTFQYNEGEEGSIPGIRV